MSRSTTAGRTAHRVWPPLTRDERVALGRAARAEVPRSAHACFQPAPDRPDPAALLESQGASRVPELLPIRYGRMAVSPFTFFRGAALPMASDLADTPRTGLTVQACGDAHLVNFGLFASPERRLVVEINDFDETLPGPWEWDVKRLATSLEIAGRHNGYPRRRVGGSCSPRCGPTGERCAGSLAGPRSRSGTPTRTWRPCAQFRLDRRVSGAQRKRLTRTLAKARSKDNLGALQRFAGMQNGRRRSSPTRRSSCLSTNSPATALTARSLKGNCVGCYARTRRAWSPSVAPC